MNIENKLKRVNKTVISGSIAFLGIGATCLYAPGSLLTISLATLSAFSIPMLLLENDIRRNWEDFRRAGPSRSMMSYFYKNVFREKLKAIEKLTDPYLQKYELLFLSAFMTHHKAELHTILDIKSIDKVERLSDSLIQQGVTKHNIEELLHNAKNDTEKFHDIFMEDFHDSKRLAQMKQVYSQYQELGFLGKNLLHPNANTEALMALQEGFSITDFEYFKIFIKEDEKHGDARMNSSYDRYENYYEIIMNKVVEEKNPEHLDILKRFFKYSLLSEQCDIKKSFDNLNNKISHKQIENTPTKRKPKI